MTPADIPEGWTLVRNEPTQAQAQRFLEVLQKKGFGPAWKAALMIAPKPDNRADLLAKARQIDADDKAEHEAFMEKWKEPMNTRAIDARETVAMLRDLDKMLTETLGKATWRDLLTNAADLIAVAYLDDDTVILPREPTYQMCEAMEIKWESGPGFPKRWRAMLAEWERQTK